MIRNTFATTDLLACTPSSANVVKTVVYFSDKTATAYTGGNEVHSLAAAAKATICGTPASGYRDIDHVIICATGGANTITIQQTVSGTDYQITQAVLATNETLEYTHAGGWRTLDANGNPKTTQGGWTIAAGKAGTLSNSLTLAGTDGTTMTFPTTSASVARQDGTNTFTDVQTVNLNVAALPAPTTGTVLHLGQSDATTSLFLLDGFAAGPGFVGRRSSGTAGSKSAVGNTQTMMSVQCYGYGATGYSSASRANIIWQSAEAWSDAAQGTRLLFQTTPTGGTSTATAAILNSDASLTLGSVAGTGVGSLYAGTYYSGTTAGLTQGSTSTLGKSITVVGGLVTAFA